jgi:transposase
MKKKCTRKLREFLFTKTGQDQYSDFCFLNEQGKEVCKPFQLDDTAAGYRKLLKIIAKLVEDGNVEVYSAVESTGGYENNWHSFLMEMSRTLPLHMSRLNPLGVKKIADARVSGVWSTSSQLPGWLH